MITTMITSTITITIRTWGEWGIDQLKEANPNLDPMAVWAQQLRDKAANFSGPGGERFFNELYLSATYQPEDVVKTSVLNDMDFQTTPLVGQMPTLPEIGGECWEILKDDVMIFRGLSNLFGASYKSDCHKGAILFACVRGWSLTRFL